MSEDEVLAGVAVNEVVELAKTFSDDKSKQFINGVLAGLLKDPELNINSPNPRFGGLLRFSSQSLEVANERVHLIHWEARARKIC